MFGWPLDCCNRRAFSRKGPFMVVNEALASVTQFSLIGRELAGDTVGSRRRTIRSCNNPFSDLKPMLRHFMDHPDYVSFAGNSAQSGPFCKGKMASQQSDYRTLVAPA